MKSQLHQEKAKFWCDRDLGNLELLRATYISHSFSRHTHESYAIGVVEAGIEGFRYQGSNHLAPPSSVVVVHPGEVHTGHAVTKSGWTYRMFYPETHLLQKAASELADCFQPLPYFPTAVIQDRQLAAQMCYLHLRLENSASKLEKESLLIWTFAQLISKYAQAPPSIKPITPEFSAVKQTQEYLRANYTENISLEQLSNLVNLKPLRLLRVFRKAMGLPPHAYLLQVRVTQAKKLLTMGISIAEVAVETGFSDQSHLHRHFKRFVGVTPGQYVRGFENRIIA
ncbi:AraC family transcriptional regulator [Hyella patelloides LEGE 07179]|uniref:AraC family transcriptional regulator n=1 Tax=Hyella patelloides LEGE 07179 TaxID=945734 RepID=A0A563VQU3_9CYAN|nr:AraC family transcriptional regulator [Hyella patelloides]VEP13836.1 AraC family transcriptional regulator [Hyella patelloides LEGE 07179]